MAMNRDGTGRDPRVNLTAALAEEEDKLLACVHCGFCLQACPTYTRLGDEADSPRGRLHLMRAVAEGRLEPDADAFGVHIDRCLGCRACETVCPSGVEYGHLLEQSRAVLAEERGTNLPTRLLLGVFGSRILSATAMAGGRLLRSSGLGPMLLRLLPGRFARVRFGLAMLLGTRPWRGLSPVAPGPIRVTAESRRVAMLTGCVQQELFGRVNRATIAVLEANGCEVVPVAAQVCCGALHAHGGAKERARSLARRNIDAFGSAEVEVVVVNAAGCGLAMKEYGTLLADDPDYAERASGLAARVRDVSEFLDMLGPRSGGTLPLRVTYDAPCHLHHAQRITEAPLAVLRTIPGLTLLPLPDADECCGGAGIYGLLHPELGGRILEDKVRAIRSTGADVVVTPNPGCMMQIGAGLLLAGLDVPVLHPIELLAESYRRESRENSREAYS